MRSQCRVSSIDLRTLCLQCFIREASRQYVEDVRDVRRLFQSIVVKSVVELTVVDRVEFQSNPLAASVIKVGQSKERHHKETRPLQ